MAEAVHSFSRFRRARHFRPLSPTMAYALRLGINASAAIWIGNVPGLADNHSSWILITVLVLTQPTTGASLKKSLFRTMGTVAAACSAILLFGLFSQDPPQLMAGLFLVQMIGAYFYLGPRYQYAWYVWAFTTAIILGDAMSGPLPVETVAFQRASMVAIGIVLVFTVDALFATERSEPQLRESLASRALEIGDRLRHAIGDRTADVSHPIEDPGEEGSHDASEKDTGPSALAGQLELVDAVRTELGVSRRAANELAHLAVELETVASLARRLSGPSESPIVSPENESSAGSAAQSELARQVEIVLQEVAASVRADLPAAHSSGDLERALVAVEAECDQIVDRLGPSPSQEGRLAELRDLVATLIEVESIRSSSSYEAPPEAASRQPFWLVRPDPFRVKIAIRTGIAVIVAFLVPMTLGWPVNIVVTTFAFIVAAKPTRGALLETTVGLTAVVALAWLVADVAIVYFMPHLGRAPMALVVPFAVGAAFATISHGRPLFAMLPIVGGVVALTSIFGGMEPPTDVYGTYSLVCYMGVAITVGTLCSRTIWSTTVSGLFRQRIVAQLELYLKAVRLGPTLGGVREQSRTSGAIERDRRATDLIRAHTALSATPSDPHDSIEEGLDPSRQARIRVLSRDLMDAVIGDQRSLDEAALAGHAGESLRKLLEALQHEREALAESMQASVDVMRGDVSRQSFDPTELAAARHTVDERMNALRADPDGLANLSDDQTRDFLGKLDTRGKLVLCQQAVEDWFRDWAGATTA